MSGELRSISCWDSGEKTFFRSFFTLVGTSERGGGLPEHRRRTWCCFGSGWGCWSGRSAVSLEDEESEQVDPTGEPVGEFIFP